MSTPGIFILENDTLRVRFLAKGAELCSVYAKHTSLEYIWQADPSVWARHAPVLFPIVGKLNGDRYTYREHTYSLPQHGFARDLEFICIEQAEDTIAFELTANNTTRINYPFHFSLQIRYTLQQSTLQVSYTVFNPDNDPLFFSIGAHPGFNCPLVPGESFGDYVLEFPGLNNLQCTKLSNGSRTDDSYTIPLQEHTLAVSRALFANDALVTRQQIQQVSLISSRSGHGVSMNADSWPWFGIWSKKDAGDFICLEPWQGVADAVTHPGELSEKEAILRLAPFETFTGTYSMSFY